MKIRINAEGFSDLDKSKIKDMLESIGLTDVGVSFQREWDDFLATLPKHSIEGFNNKVDEWFDHWAAGGGDYSTEDNIRNASESDNPYEWSIKAYSSVVGYCKDHFQASDLISLAVSMVLNDLKVSLTKSFFRV